MKAINLITSNDPFIVAMQYIQFKDGKATATDSNCLLSLPISELLQCDNLPNEFYIKGSEWKAAKADKSYYQTFNPDTLMIEFKDAKHNILGYCKITLDLFDAIHCIYPKWKEVVPENSLECRQVEAICVNADILQKLQKIMNEVAITMVFLGKTKCINIHFPNTEVKDYQCILMPCMIYPNFIESLKTIK